MKLSQVLLLGCAAIVVGCLKIGAELCPPTVVIQRDDGATSIRLTRDAGAAPPSDGGAK